VRFVEGRLDLLYGGALPALKEGAVGELILPEWEVTDRYVAALLQQVAEVEMFPAETHLFVQVRLPPQAAPGISGYHRSILVWSNSSWSAGPHMEIVILEPLMIILRGTKLGELQGYRVQIPVLQGALSAGTEIMSINHAYTLISQLIETHRRSHNGNVFDKVFFRDDKGALRPLAHRREHLEAEAEYALIMMLRPWWINTHDAWDDLTWAYAEQVGTGWMLYEIDSKSQVQGKWRLPVKQAVEDWLKSNGYVRFTPDGEHVWMHPPAPPYRDHAGELFRLSTGLP